MRNKNQLNFLQKIFLLAKDDKMYWLKNLIEKNFEIIFELGIFQVKTSPLCTFNLNIISTQTIMYL